MIIIDDITLIKKIGKELFGEVFLASRKETDQIFTVKKVPKNFVLQEKVNKYFKDELF